MPPPNCCIAMWPDVKKLICCWTSNSPLNSLGLQTSNVTKYWVSCVCATYSEACIWNKPSKWVKETQFWSNFHESWNLKAGLRGAAIPLCPVEVEGARQPQPHQQVLRNPAQLKKWDIVSQNELSSLKGLAPSTKSVNVKGATLFGRSVVHNFL